MMKKKLSMYLLILAMAAFMIPGVGSAQPVLPVEKQADVLVQLGLMQGANDGLHLGDSLTRAQATTFIVRLLGKETDVLNDSSLKSQSFFKDIQPVDWYAPYVNYGFTQHIIDGYSDGTFKPEDMISEKAFVKLVLGALGYQYGQDFQWNNVFLVAKEVGLLTELKTADNPSFLRSGVVSVLFQALATKQKNTSQTTVQRLISQGKVSLVVATSAGVLPESEIKLENVNPTALDTVQLTFSDKVKSIKADQFQVYETGKQQSPLKTEIASQTETTLTLKVSGLESDHSYNVMLQNIEDQKGAIKTQLTGAFKPFVAKEIHSTMFRISKVEAISKNVVSIYFTQPVTANIQVPMLYELLDDKGVSFVKGDFSTLGVNSLESNANVLQLYLKTKSLENKTYTIKISGDTQSLYGVKLNNGSGDQYTFMGTSQNDSGFGILTAIPLDSKTIQIDFNQEVDYSTASNPSNYSLLQNGVPYFISQAVVTGDGDQKGKRVRLALDTDMIPNGGYQLTLNGVQDAFQRMTISSAKYIINGYAPAATQLKLVNVMADDAGTVRAYFNKHLNASSVTNTNLYTIQSSTASIIPAMAYYTPDRPYEVKLFLRDSDKLDTGVDYQLTVSNAIQDELGVMPTELMQKSFKGPSIAVMTPQFTRAQVISNDAVMVQTNKELSLNGANTITSNYTLEYSSGGSTVTKQSTSVSIIGGNIIVIHFDSFPAVRFTVKANQLLDYSGQYTTNSTSVGVDPAN